MVPAFSSGTLTIVLPHWNAMLQTRDVTPHLVTVYRHRADLSLCYPLMWNVTLEATTTCFNVLGLTETRYPFPHFHTLDKSRLNSSDWLKIKTLLKLTILYLQKYLHY